MSPFLHQEKNRLCIFVLLLTLFGYIILVVNSFSHEAIVSDPSNLDKVNTAEYKYTVIIDPGDEKAVDDKLCFPPSGGGNSSVPCKSLKYAFQQFQNFNSVMFYLSSPKSIYQLNLTATFIGIDGIGIVGNGSLFPDVPVVECKPLVGLSFLNSENIQLDSVTFMKCGASQQSTSMDLNEKSFRLLMINVSLYFYNCTNVFMHQLKVINSTQGTGVVMYDVDGQVEVNNCNFTTNHGTTADKYLKTADRCLSTPPYYGGGGFAVEFPYCRPGYNKCRDWNYDTGEMRRNRDAVYVFKNSTFHNNVACGQNVTDYGGRLLSSNSSHQAVGRGGGLSLFLKGDAANNSIKFVNCLFRDNHAIWGGGLFIEMEDNTLNNTINISSCRLIHNHAFFVVQLGTAGGGLHISTLMYLWTDTMQSTTGESNIASRIYIEKSNFTDNHAPGGGAISLVLSHQNQCCPIDIRVSNCVIKENKAQLGAAVYVRLFAIINEGYVPQVEFRSCSFVKNSIKYENETMHTVGMGIMYVNQIPIIFKDHINFTENDGSALGVVGASLDFTSASALFLKNRGLVGAGIALLGTASILVGNTTVLNFTKNHATQYGGAIYNEYIVREDLRYDIECFIHYEMPYTIPQKWTSSFVFINNAAERRGHAIFSSSILPCSYGSDYVEDILCWNKQHWDYGDSNCSEPNLISTNPHYFVPDGTNLSTPIDVYPGLEFSLPFYALDDRRENITDDSLYYAFIYNKSQTAKVQKEFSYVVNNTSITGIPENNVTLVMQTESSQIMHVRLNLVLRDCPPGFTNVSQGPEFECKCLENSYGYSLKCFSDVKRSFIQVDKWLGNLTSDDKTLCMSIIPSQYREQTNHDFKELPLDRIELNDKLCHNVNRTHVLCGECLPHYAVAVNSPDYPCVLCNVSTSTITYVGYLSAYIALTYGPIFVLFLAIIFLNFKLTSSAAMGFVLYAQMVGSEVFSLTPNVLLSNNNYKVVELAYTTIYGIFNLNSLSFLMNPFCLNKNFNTLDVICLDYVIAAFPLIMIFLIYLTFRCLSRFRCPKRYRSMVNISEEPQSSLSSQSILMEQQQKPPRITLVHAFSAFMFLSYTKFCLASMKTMSMSDFYNSKGEYCHDRRISLAGQWRFTDSKFLFPYGIIAIFVFIVAVLLPPFLLLGPIQFVDWLIERPRFNCLHKIWPSIAIHTVIDTFQGFYKPRRRFFGGVFVLFRLVVFISFSFGDDINQHYAITQIAVVILICLIAMFRPYTNEMHNQVNILIFLNLSILNTLAILMYNDGTMHFSAKIYPLQCTLVWLPLIYIICYAIWQRIKKKKSFQRVEEKVKKRLHWHRLVSPLSEDGRRSDSGNLLNQDNSSDGDNSDEDIFQRAKSKNLYRPPSKVESSAVDATVYTPSSLSQSCSSDVTVTEVSGPNHPEIKAKNTPSTGDSGTGTGTGQSSGIDVKYTD